MDTYTRHQIFLVIFWVCMSLVVAFTVYFWSSYGRYFGYSFSYGCYETAPVAGHGGSPGDLYAAALRMNPIVGIGDAEVSSLGYLFLCVGRGKTSADIRP